jgi:uncharacterized protein
LIVTSAFLDSEDGIKVFIRLQPNVSANRIDQPQEQADGICRLRVKVTAVPEKGKANKALIKLLSKALRIAPSMITVVSGVTDRNKTLLIRAEADLLLSDLERLFARHSI